MSLSMYGEPPVANWASWFKDVHSLKRYKPDGASLRDELDYYDHGDMHKAMLINQPPPLYLPNGVIEYRPPNDNLYICDSPPPEHDTEGDRALISKFIETAEKEVIRTAHGEVTHYTRG